MKALLVDADGEPTVLEVEDDPARTFAQALGTDSVKGHVIPWSAEDGHLIIAYYPGRGGLDRRVGAIRDERPVLLMAAGKHDLCETDLLLLAAVVTVGDRFDLAAAKLKELR